MEGGKDYIWYFWNIENESWLEEFSYLWKDKALRGLSVTSLIYSRMLPKEKDFNLELLMTAQDVIQCCFNVSPKAIKRMGNVFPLRNL